jgi:hypothetical protein
MINFSLVLTTLILGDSHLVGPFGQQLDQALRFAGYQVATYGSCGSIGSWWFSGQKTTCGFYSSDIQGVPFRAKTFETPYISELLKTLRPDSVIVKLGTNYVRGYNESFIRADLLALVREIKQSGARCYWILPPDMRRFRSELPKLNSLILETIKGDCRVFDSPSVTQYPQEGGDGIHYGFPGGDLITKRWAQSVLDDFKWFSSSEE